MFKSCPNTECENDMLYENEDDKTECPDCGTKLEVFVYDKGMEEQEEFEEEEDDDDEDFNDPVLD